MSQALKPVNQFILLGASNLTLSMRLIIQLMQQQYGGPSEVLVAAGHGRSYGMNSVVLVRELPGIVRSGLWRQLQANVAETPNVTYAFLTDIGNDIPYGFTPKQILGWVSWCVDQLQQRSAHIVMTNLPIASIELMPEWRFKLLRQLMFPSCTLSRSAVIDRAWIVHQGLADLAVQRRLILHELEPTWMSFDGIHVAYRKRRAFYRQLFKPDDSRVVQPGATKNAQKSFLSWQQRPQFAVRRVFGRVERVAQPSGYFMDRTAVSLY